MLALQMGQVTNGYLVFDLTGSATAVGVVTLGFGVPMLFLSLVGGVVADRFPKRRILIVSQILTSSVALVFALLVLIGRIEVWMMALGALVMGTSFAFNMPARQAYIAEIVSRDHLTNAVALNNTGMNFARVIGPSIAGALIGVAFIGIGGVYLIMAAMYLVVMANLLRLPDVRVADGATDRSGLGSMIDGLRYIRGSQELSALLILAFVPVALGMPFQALMPVFAKDVFGVGARGLGLLLMLNGAGALIGSLVVASLGNARRRALLQMGMGIAFGLALALFAFAQSLPVAVVTLVIIGAVSAGYLALNATIIMDKVDQAYRGRVMSVYLMTFSLMPLMVVPLGALSDAFGAPLAVGASGLLLAAVVLGYGLLHPTYRHID